MNVMTRQEAITAGVDTYFTGKPCPKGHVALRRVSGACCECARLLKNDYAKRNPEKVKAWKAEDQKKHRAGANERSLRWYHGNRDQARAATARWQRDNRWKVAAKAARRRAAELRQTPGWADLTAIAQIYLQAQWLRDQGIDVHVDHEVPLQGETVSGLHVHYNLQIIDATINRQKSNRFKEHHHVL